MDKCRRCGQEGEIRDLLCFTCTQEVKAIQTRTERTELDKSDEESQVA